MISAPEQEYCSLNYTKPDDKQSESTRESEKVTKEKKTKRKKRGETKEKANKQQQKTFHDRKFTDRPDLSPSPVHAWADYQGP